jgi:MBG domain-containing protein
VNGDGIAGVTLTSTGAGARAAAGTYPILAGGAVATAGTNLANYAIAYQNGTITVVAVPGVIGLRSVSIRGGRAVIDNIARLRFGLASNGSIALQGSTVRGNVLSTHGSVMLTKTGRVTGSVTAGRRIRNAGNIGGVVKAHAPSPAITARPIAPCSPFSDRTGLSGGFTYDPATGDLRVNAGATLTLAPGAYCFHSVSVLKRSELKVTGPVTIAVTGRLLASGALLNTTTASPQNLLIVSSYTGANGVGLAGRHSAYLAVYAPSTRIAVSGGGAIFGGLLGGSLAVSGNADVHFDLPR